LNNKYLYLTLSIFSLIIILPFIGIFSRLEFQEYSASSIIVNKYILRIIFFSFYQAFISALLSCLIAIPFALALNRHKNLTIIKLIISISGFSFVIPAILIVYAFIKLFGKNGFYNYYFNFYEMIGLNSIYGTEAIIISHILLNAPFASRLFFQNLNNIPNKYYEISSSLNLTYFVNIYKLEIPIIRQNLFTVFSIIFSLCFLSFAIVMALGGGPLNSTIEVAIYQYALFELNFDKAIVLSFIQIFICLIFVYIGFNNLKGSRFFEININSYIHPHKDYKFIKISDYIFIFFLSLFLFSPIICILINFINQGLIEDFLFNKSFINALLNSIAISMLTGLIVSVSGLFITILLTHNYKKPRLQKILFLLTSSILIISPVIFSLGYFIILGEYRYIKFFNFLVVILINSIFLIPFSILILFNNLKNIYLTYEDFKETYRIKISDYYIIIFPLIKKNILYVFSFSTVITFGDFTIISFFKNQNFETLPSLLFRLISSYRFNEASFVAGIILIISLIIYFLIDNFTYKVKPVKNI
tara:strand:+ start:1036 stop:2628 length:1593 start_codon:yes stop_codon:yes gene_type:complete